MPQHARMAEPLDTIRRVNSGEPMTLQELQQARAVLDSFAGTNKADVREARRRVGGLLSGMETPPGQSSPPIANPLAGVQPGKADRKLGALIWAVLLLPVLLVAGCITYVVNNGGGGDEDGAVAYCHQFVEDRLKLPDTADFPSFPDHEVIETSDASWRVSAWVEAENSFGGTVRTDWTCEITYEEASETWTLESLAGL